MCPPQILEKTGYSNSITCRFDNAQDKLVKRAGISIALEEYISQLLFFNLNQLLMNICYERYINYPVLYRIVNVGAILFLLRLNDYLTTYMRILLCAEFDLQQSNKSITSDAK